MFYISVTLSGVGMMSEYLVLENELECYEIIRKAIAEAFRKRK